MWRMKVSRVLLLLLLLQALCCKSGAIRLFNWSQGAFEQPLHPTAASFFPVKTDDEDYVISNFRML